ELAAAVLGRAREGSADVPALARHFLAEAAANFGRRPKILTEAALSALVAYRWPGNVRELKNVMERLVILSPGEEIGREDLPAEVREAGDPAPAAADASLKAARDDFERRYILAALRRHRGNVSRTAEALEVERSNLYKKLKSYGIEVEREN
ncbi:MAG TPA: helix-turn-helix domain-containing protein, partial [Thermoanaerobaculia bacterium]